MPQVIPVRTHFNIVDLWFDPADSGACKGDHVLVSTERGTEIGLVTSDPFNAPKDEVKGDLKHVMRVATEADLERAEDLARRGEEAMPVFRQLVKESGLDMKPVGVEFLFGGEKVVFYFAAEDRVDFRDLVRDLASHFKQRVDMRQIGVRDEARLVGGYAPCGQELCCVRFGGEFEPVSIRMAKEQDLPLNSSKISGVCGRLMCCLRYEFEAYRDFKQRAPKKNAVIETPLGKAKIVEYNTPRETLTLRLENGKSFVIALADMTCSEGCCKRAAEQHIPLRPDTVTREALEQLGTPDIVMQLAELDRANGGVGYVLDDSLLEVKRTPRRRSQTQPEQGEAEKAGAAEGGKRGKGAKQAAEEPAEQDRKPRRRSQGSEAAANAGAEEAQQPVRRSRRGRPLPPDPAPEETQAQQQAGEEQQRRTPRGGGMKPRRTNRGAEKGAEKAGDQQGRQQAAPEKAGEGKAQAPQTSRRTRRHHSAAESQQAARGEQQAAGQEKEQGRQQRQRRQRGNQQGRQAEGAAAGGQQGRQEQAQQSKGDQQEQARQPRQRRQRRSGGQGGSQQGVSAKPQGGEGSPAGEQQRQPRRRRPGDKGGQPAPQAE